ncbi:MAG: type II toxin-antitoxin system RelE/ParE family toxin [Deltaproteobacteria bacterium]|nr:type II toxin-antitoxin system RelE/ParE family toxin [Deltaproteobacteria bacterium]
MNIVLLHNGSDLGFSLYGLTKKNQCPVWNFVSGLEEKDQKQVFTLFNLILEKGLPIGEERFRNLGDKIYELKTRGGVRILAFFGSSSLHKSLVLTHGFYKPHTKILKREKEKALKLYKEYLKRFDSKKKSKDRGAKP